ncbi:glycerophosphodiester phosphodiesterase [Agromyces atrinae]|uniref:Glycerophosphodiester phosphodiesterase n=1 Tax=Agromyces atrinae TaxID=592376 RepID=A0A4V1R2A5_9MICO|nr:glycerophosphodiester phosphodiesterase [Agromyces atrinae]NYD66132.1 glycerophosphoryl diester phosphodiesterase [Agromyces atrinae]RXZ86476.1 glycerophosphodiester phosphodiesterase [Agromyces atrinae]
MQVEFFGGTLPRVFAHRGLAVDAPENTLLAFARAVSAGVRYIETDVHVSHEGVAIVAHDPDLKRVAGRPVRIDQLTVPELRRIDLGSAQGFCTLEEALDAFPETCFNIDVKTDAAALPISRAIARTRAEKRVLIASFSDARRKRVLAALPRVASSAGSATIARVRAALSAGAVRRALADVSAVQVPERYGALRIVSRTFVDRVHAAGHEVHVWTVNETDDMQRLLDLGVDGIITDRADQALDVVRRRSPRP